MKPTPAERLADLERLAIARHLASAPGADESAFIAELRREVQGGEFFESRQWTGEDQWEARRLWIESRLGLDALWAAPPADLFVSKAAYERYLALSLQEQPRRT
jgi:hypothetical protein